MELSCKYVSNGLHPYLWQPVIAHWDANKLIINSIQLLDQLGSLVIGSWVTADVSDDRVWLGNPPLTLSIFHYWYQRRIRVLTNSCLQPTSVLEKDALLITSHRIIPSRWLAINYGWTENTDYEVPEAHTGVLRILCKLTLPPNMRINATLINYKC